MVPRVLLDLLEGDALDRVGLEHPVDEVLDTMRYVVGDEVPAVFDLTEKLRHLIVIKGERAAHHCVQDDTTRPDIYLCTAIAKS